MNSAYYFCLTDALNFEKASYHLVKGDLEPAPKRSEYPKGLVKVRTSAISVGSMSLKNHLFLADAYLL